MALPGDRAAEHAPSRHRRGGQHRHGLGHRPCYQPAAGAPLRHGTRPVHGLRWSRSAAGWTIWRVSGFWPQPPAAIYAPCHRRTGAALAVAGADHVQECVPELLELKRDCSRRSTRWRRRLPDRQLLVVPYRLPAWRKSLPGRARCLVVHPGNPPYLLRWPSSCRHRSPPGRRAATERLLRAAGILPVRVAREVEGFVFNRLQGAAAARGLLPGARRCGVGGRHRPPGARRARAALVGRRAVRDGRPQQPRRHRRPCNAHGPGL